MRYVQWFVATFLRRTTTIGGNRVALYTTSTRSCGGPAGRRGPINCNKFAAYTMTSTWRRTNGQATPCTTTTAIFRLTAYLVDRCECPISINLAMNKQEREVKVYMFARERPGKIPTFTKRNHTSTSSDHGNNKGTSSKYRQANRPRTIARPQQQGTRSSLEQDRSTGNRDTDPNARREQRPQNEETEAPIQTPDERRNTNSDHKQRQKHRRRL